jgi:hypothetical protein
MKKLFVGLVGLSLIFVVALAGAQERSVSKITLPDSPQEENIVDVQLSQRIALSEARKRFGEVTLRKPIVGYSLNGSIRAYIFPFRLGSGTFPSDEEILERIDNAKQMVQQAKANLAKVRHIALTVVKTPEWEYAEQNLTDIEHKCWGTGVYGTIIVSARRDLAPVVGGSNGLPYYYTYRKIAKDKAKESLSTSFVSLNKYYFDGDMDQIFEFQSPTGEKIWIVMFPFRVVKPGEIKIKRLQVTEEEKKWIEQKWNKITREVQNEK